MLGTKKLMTSIPSPLAEVMPSGLILCQNNLIKDIAENKFNNALSDT